MKAVLLLVLATQGFIPTEIPTQRIDLPECIFRQETDPEILAQFLAYPEAGIFYAYCNQIIKNTTATHLLFEYTKENHYPYTEVILRYNQSGTDQPHEIWMFLITP